MIFVLCGLIFIGIGIFMIVHSTAKPGQETVEATVVEHSKETSTSVNNDGPSTTTTSTFPVYEYQLNGKTYRGQSNVGITFFSKTQTSIGSKEHIRVDPAKPTQVHTEAEVKASKTMGIICIIFGILAFIAAL